MSFDYAKMQATASRLLANFGAPITVQIVTGVAVDVEAGAKVKTYTNATGSGVMLNYRNSEVNGDLVHTSDKKLIIENLSVEPVVDSKVGDYRVMNVMPLNPAGTNLMYTLQLRK